MKKLLLTAATALLILAMLAGCGKPQAELPAETEPSTSATEPAAESTEAPTEAATEAPTEAATEATATEPATEAPPAETEAEAAAPDLNELYAQQIERYYTAISQQWDEMAYFDHDGRILL